MIICAKFLLPSSIYATVTLLSCLNSSDTKHSMLTTGSAQPWRPWRCSGQQHLLNHMKRLPYSENKCHVHFLFVSCFMKHFSVCVTVCFGPDSVCWRLTVDSVCFLFAGMAAALWLPPFCRPQNVSAALCSSHAVCYRCHAAPLRSQCHRDAGQQHYRVSHLHFRSLVDAAFELGIHRYTRLNRNFHRDFLSWFIYELYWLKK